MKWLAAVVALFTLFGAESALAQNCTITATEVPSLRVTRGSSNVVILDTSDAATVSAMRTAGCPGDTFNAASIFVEKTDGTQLNTNQTVATTSNGSYTYTSPNGNHTRVLRYTPPAGGSGTQTLQISTATATSPSAGTWGVYNNAQSIGTYITIVVTVQAPTAPSATLTSLTPSTIYAGGTSTVVVTLTNTNAGAALAGVGNSITLPSGVTVASTPGASTTCGGSVTATAGASSVSLSGGSLAAGTSTTCTMTFNVTSSTVATHSINSGTPSATGAGTGSAGTSQNLVVQAAPSPPTISAAFSPTTVGPSGSSTLTLTLTNPNGSTQLTGVAVAAAALPANLSGSSAGTTCTSGTPTYSAGTRELSLAGATLNGGASCTLTLTVSSTTPGSYSYTSGAASASGPASVTGSTASTSTPLIVVGPPTSAMSLNPSSIAVGGTTQATLTLTNPNSASALSGVDSGTISMPSNVTLSNLAGITNNCGGSLTSASGSIRVNSVGLAASASCTVIFDLSASSTSGSPYTIPAGTPSATTAGTGSAGTSASLTVTNPAALSISLSRSGTPTQGQTFGYTVTVGNTGGASTSGNVTVSSTLPAGLSYSSATGANWSCAGSSGTTLSCAFSGTIAASGSNNALVVTLAVAADSAVSRTVTLGASGGGASNTPTASDTFAVAQTPASFANVTGGGQSATISTAFATAFAVTVYDAAGVVIPGASVTFTAPASGASGTFATGGTNSQTVTANGSGVATASSFTANGTVGSYNVAVASGSAAANIAASNTAPVLSANQAVASASGTAGTAITAFTPVTATGGYAPLGYAIAPALPSGLSISSSTGQISGTPGVALSATTFTVTITDSTPGTAQTASNSFQLTIARAASTTTIGATTAIVAGANASYTATVSGVSPTGTVTFQDGGSDIAGCVGVALAGGSATCTHSAPSVGSHTITAIYSGDSNNNGSTSSGVTQTVYTALTTTVAQASVTGTFNTPLTVTTPVTAAGGEGTLSYALSGSVPSWVSFDTSNGQISGTPSAALAATTLTVTVTDQTPGTAQSSAKTFTLTIAKADQTISFAALSNASLSASPLTLSATADSGLTVAFASTTTSVCTVSGTTLTLVATGTCSITASQAGDGNRNAAPDVVRSFTVTPASLVLTAGAATGLKVGVAYSQANTASGGVAPYAFALNAGAFVPNTTLDPATGTVSGTPTVAGSFSYQLRVTDSQSTPAVTIGGITTVTIAKGDQTISFTSTAPGNARVNGATYQPTATATSGGAVTFAIDGSSSTVCTISSGVVSFIGTGTCRINASQAGNSNYDPAPDVAQSFAVTAAIAAPSVTAPANGATVTSTTPAIAGTAEANATVTVVIDGATAGTVTASGGGAWSFTPASALGEGGHTVLARAADGAGNGSPDSATISFSIDSIAPATPSVTAPAQGLVSAGNTVTISGAAEAGSTVTVYLNNAAVGTTTATGASTYSFTSGALADAAYAAHVTATDPAGNVSGNSNTRNFTVDTTAPAAPSITAPTNGAILGSTTPAITGTAEANATVTVVIDGATAGTATASAGGGWSFTPGTALAQGAHGVRATATDAAGNVSTSSSTISFTIDTDAPAAPAITAPAGGALLATTTPAISGTAEANSTVTVSIDGSAAGTTTAGAGGAWSFTPGTALAQGGHMVTARATDAAGNVSGASNSVSFTVDTQGPAAPAITAPGAGATLATTTPAITGTAEANATIAVVIDGATAGTTAASAGGGWSFTPGTALAQGAHSVRVTATDAAGNVSSSSPTVNFSVDTSAPVAPVLISPANGVTLATATPAISGTAEANATVTVTIDGTVAGTTTAGGGGAWSFTPGTALAQGAHSAHATATDAAGNVSTVSNSHSFTVDTAAPAAPAIAAPADGAVVATTTPVLSGTAEAGATVTLVVDGATAGTTTASGGGAWSFTSAALAQGAHTARSSATDAVGNVSASSPTISFTVDTQAPAAPTVIAPANGATLATAQPVISGTAEANATVTVVIDGATAGTATASAGGAWSFTPGTALAQGGHGVRATATDGAGNASASSATVNFTIDSLAPAAPSVAAPTAGSTTASTTPTISGTAEAGATVTVLVDGTAIGTTIAGGGGAWSLTPGTALGQGAHAVAATATDAVGNVSPASAAVNFTVDSLAPAAPAVTAPIAGSVTGDNTPTISGTAEAGATVTVVIDGATAGTATATGGSWSFTAATLAEGAHSVRAIATDTGGNVSPSSATIGFTVDTAAPGVPTIIAPASGATLSTATPTISGTAEANAVVTVTIDGTAAGTVTASAGGAWSFTPGTALAQGAHAVLASAVDAAGNGSGNSAATSFTIDTQAPGAPAIAAPANGAVLTSATPTISGSAEANAVVTVTIDGATAGTVTASAGGAWSFTSAALAEGAHSVSARATDGVGNLSAASATVNFTIDSSAPAAPAVTAPAAGATVSTATPAISGTAEANATVTVVIDGTTAGTTTASAGGGWSFTPGGALAQGAHSVRAVASDAGGNVSPSSASVAFIVDTQAPGVPVIASPASGAILATRTPVISGTAEAGATITLILDGATAGTVTADGAGAWSFTPAALAEGAHSVQAVATDAVGNASASSATTSFTIDSAVPAAPAVTAPAPGAVLASNTPVISGTAEAGATVRLFVDGGLVATLTATGGSWSHTSAALAPGSHSVHAIAIDGAGNASPASATVTFSVTPAPVAGSPPAVAVPYGTATAIDLAAHVTGTATSIAIATAPTHGTATVNGMTVTYTPAAGYHGADSFAYTATGPGGTSAPATVTLNVAVPAAPVAADRAGVAVPYGSSGTAIDLSGSITGVRSGIAITVAPAHGTASVAGEVVTYVPNAGHYGADSFTYAATGPGGTSAPAVVSVAVGNPPAPIAANPAAVAVAYGSPGTAIDLAGSVTGVYTSLAIATPPAHGTVTLAGTVATYVPAAGHHGADGFTFTATGPGGTSAPATVTLNVAVPAAPVAADRPDVAVPHGSSGTAIDLSISVTGVRTSIAIGTAPTHGTATVAGELVTYVPAAGYYGADSFTYAATGPGGTSNVATVSIMVGNPPAPAVANRADVAVAFDSPGTAIDLASAVTGVYASLAIATQPAHGTVTLAGTVATYRPAAGYHGADSFTVTATGPGGTSPAATIGLVVAAPPPPAAQPTTDSVSNSTSTATNDQATIDLSALVTGIYDTITIDRQPQHGTVTLSGGQTAAQRNAVQAMVSMDGAARPLASTQAAPIIATYTPNPGFVGTDTFQFVAIGPGGRSAPATVTITVVGAAPTVTPKTASTGDGQRVSIDLTTGATEGPFTAASIVSVTPAGSATATIVDSGSGAARSFRLDVTPAARFGGTIVVSYRLSNAHGTSDPSTVTITVEARPDPSTDGTVTGLSDAQAETARRFARAQIENFMQRNEQLHGGGGSGDPSFAMRLNSRDSTGGLRLPPGIDDQAFEITARMHQGAVADAAYAQFLRSGSLEGFRRMRADEQVMRAWGVDPVAGLGTMTARGVGRARGASTGDAGAGIASGMRRGVVDPVPSYGAAEPEDDRDRRVGQFAIWTGGSIEIGTLDRTTDRAKITASTGGLSAGIDVKLAESVTLGIGGGYGNEVSKIGSGAARVRGESGVVAGYASFSPGAETFVDGMIGYGQLNYRLRRNVAAVGATAIGSRDGDMVFGAVSAGIDRGGDALRWSAYGRFEVMKADLDAYVEHGAGRFDLRFDARSLTSASGVLGGRAEFRQKTSFGAIVPRVRAEWRHEFADSDAQGLDYADIPGLSIYRIDTQGWKRDQFELSFGSRAELLLNWTVDLELGLSAGQGERVGRLRIDISKEF